MNQHRNSRTITAKAQTTAALVQETRNEMPSQDALKASDVTRIMLSERLQKSINRRTEVEAIIDAFNRELEDEKKVIESVQMALDNLDSKPTPHPQLVQREVA